MNRDVGVRLYEFGYQFGFGVSFLAFYQGYSIVGWVVFLISLGAFFAYDAIFADIGKGE